MKITLQLERQQKPGPVKLFGREMPVDTANELNGEYNTGKTK
jgi:hypothetical protein